MKRNVSCLRVKLCTKPKLVNDRIVEKCATSNSVTKSKIAPYPTLKDALSLPVAQRALCVASCIYVCVLVLCLSVRFVMHRTLFATNIFLAHQNAF